MMKCALTSVFVLLLLCAAGARASGTPWGFDAENLELEIPAECDGQFSEAAGGVFMPSVDELYDQGMLFLVDTDTGVQRKSAYCLIAAALQDHTEAQYRLSHLYNRGLILPQDTLSAYRWAYIAALKGHAEAENLVLLLERFLTTQDIELATSSIKAMLPTISTQRKEELAAQQRLVEERQAELARINAEIDGMLGIRTAKPQGAPKTASAKSAPPKGKVAPAGAIFTAADRPRKP